MLNETERVKLKIRKRVIKAEFKSFLESIDQNMIDVEKVKLRLNKLEELHTALEEVLIKLSSHDRNLTDIVVQQQKAEYEERCI